MKKLIYLLLAALMLAAAGCGKNTAETSEVSATSAGVAVHVDYSKLTPYDPPEETYTLHEGYVKGEGLKARDDYGTLLPYFGKHLNSGHREALSEPMDELSFYGLVTDKGELVTDPIYQQIEFSEDNDFLVLYRGNPDYTRDGSCDTFFVTVAAADGSWVHDAGLCSYADCHDGLLLTAPYRGPLTVWNTKGEPYLQFDYSCGIDGPRWAFDCCVVSWKDNKVGYISGSAPYLDFETGELLDTPPAGYPAEFDEKQEEEPQAPNVAGCDDLISITDRVTGKTYFYGEVGDDSYETLFDGEGNALLKCYGDFSYYPISGITAGLYAFVANDHFFYRSLVDDSIVFCHAIQANID